MHQVNDSRMPLLRTATGCKCRKTLLITAITRVRRSRGTPWRKIEFHNCELRTYSRGAWKRLMVKKLPVASLQLPEEGASCRLYWQLATHNRQLFSSCQHHETFGIVPLAEFLAIDFAHVH